jgi:hypothetical protein
MDFSVFIYGKVVGRAAIGTIDHSSATVILSYFNQEPFPAFLLAAGNFHLRFFWTFTVPVILRQLSSSLLSINFYRELYWTPLRRLKIKELILRVSRVFSRLT